MTTRCKFRCIQKEENVVRFTPVVSGSEENENFFKWTPGGELTLWTVNEEVLQQFNVDEEYYLDISPTKVGA